MTTNHEDTFIRNLRETKLSEAARARMREELSAYADFHPAKAPVRVTRNGRSLMQEGAQSPRKGLVGNSYPMTLIASLMIALAVGGTSFAAERTVPGDTLYPVKTEVNERVRAALTFSTEGKAELAARLAERRFAEAEQLMAEGRFDAEARAALATRLEAHTEAADRAATQLDAAAAAEARARLAGTIDAHTAIIGALDADRGTAETDAFLTTLRARADASTDAEAAASVQADVSAEAAAAAIARAEQALGAARTAIARADVSAEIRARLEARLSAGDAALAEARVALDADAHARAATAAHEAIRIAEEVRATIAAAARIEIELDLSGGAQLAPLPYDTGDEPVSSGAATGSVRTQGSTSTGGGVRGSAGVDVEIDLTDPLPIR